MAHRDNADEIRQCCCSWVLSWISFSTAVAIALATGDSLSLVNKCILCFPFGYMCLSVLMGEVMYVHGRELKRVGTYAERMALKMDEEERDRKNRNPGNGHRWDCVCHMCRPDLHRGREKQRLQRTFEHAYDAVVPVAISSGNPDSSVANKNEEREDYGKGHSIICSSLAATLNSRGNGSQSL